MPHPRLNKFSEVGLMGSLIASFDWTKTSLGNPENWPSCLLTSLGIVLCNKIPMAILWGPDFIQLYNDPYIQLMGSKHPKALGKAASFSWAEISEESDKMFKQVMQGQSFFFENKPFMVNIDKKLDEHFYTFSCVPIELNTGEVGGVFLTSIEMTEKIKSKKILEESEMDFRNYQEKSPLPFLSLSENWIVDYMNPAALKISIFAVDREVGIVGKSFYELWPAARDTIFDEQYKKAMIGEFVEFEACYTPSDTWYRIFAYPLNPGVGIYFQDVTEEKKLQIELQKAIKSRDNFLSIASHELNTPLTSLKLHTQLMERMFPKGIPPDRLLKFFEQTDFQIKRLSLLVGDMLDASRIREGKMSLRLEKSDLKKVVTAGIESYAAYFQAVGLEQPSLVTKGENFTCMLDVARFDQVISNLLSNSVKYGEGKPVTITIAEEKDKFTFAVKDQGNGIQPEDQERIFDQYDRGKRIKGEGLGLGLYISKQIVMAHDGFISVESSPSAGSTFKVKLKKVE